MSKKSNFPQTKVKNAEPSTKNSDWVIWAAWADRITFEEIFEKTGKTEADVIKFMRKNLKLRQIQKLLLLVLVLHNIFLITLRRMDTTC